MLTKHKMASLMFVLKNSVPWILAILIAILLSAKHLINYFHFLLSVSMTSLALLVIIPMLLAFPKQYTFTVKKPVKQEEETEDSSEIDTEKHPRSESVSQNHGLYTDDNGSFGDQLSCFSEDDDDSDVDWPFSGNNSGQYSPHYSSDCSISDEESLIELALPSGHFLGMEKQDKNQQKFLLLQQKLLAPPLMVDFLADIINEEDNMIEIDISMGSIKCSRFEIIDEA